MAIHRFYTADLLTGNVLGDIYLYGIYFTKQINGAGNFTGTFKLGSTVTNDSLMMSCTIPAKTALYIERDGVLIWGGIIWSRTYQSNAQTVQLTAQTFESYFDRVACSSNIIQQGVEQVALFKNIIDNMQAQDTQSNIGLTYASLPSTGINRTVLLPGYEFHMYQEALDQLLGAVDSFEYTINVTASATQDRPNKVVTVGYPTLNSSITGQYYDYPGTVLNYWWPETTSEGATRFAGRGYGAGNKAPTAVVVDGTAINAGYPSLWKVASYNNIADPTLLDSKVRRDALAYAIPVNNPTFELKPDAITTFSGWNLLGAPLTVAIQDVRFPSGNIATRRMLGWEFSPSSENSSESLKIVLSNKE